MGPRLSLSEPHSQPSAFDRWHRSLKTGVLSLSNAQLKELSPEIIASLGSSLTSLDLTANKLEFLPEDIKLLVSLKSLNVQQNRLTSLPTELGTLTKLETLNLARNAFTSFPLAVCQLGGHALRKLTLSGNFIRGLPDDIAQLGSLRELDVSQNALVSLPIVLAQLDELQELNADANQLREIPAQFAALKSIKIISVRNNLLEDFPADVLKFTMLTGLNVDGNPLTFEKLSGRDGFEEFSARRKSRIDQLL
ncbi:hypothetical protein BC938DRAFT_473456 [Jimgerdemannia flammicorona]|uniref:Uncharacterized protein n=1 Tax=Jimgerdemannia flammicorona TaxID=994334 RepID=A0A433Q4D0_9FUNG|nr:hypothetical protein BC938DRAFT_473456 [Jimgerdemannia flammicorona]